ncbi:UbiA family prenyltransferase [Candidatus Sumerlaeota bacterium]|nr:UbiA family prenyltransferase [Candidatus Sumerlaeota bacterium]
MKLKPPSLIAKFARTHLTLGRVSNLPTVWADCVAAWALANGAIVWDLFMMMGVMSLLYVGGMYLNDACDAEIDDRNNAPRPIPRGKINRNVVYIFAFVFLALGLMLSSYWGWIVLSFTAALACTIIIYNVIHNRVWWSPFLMGLCRTLVYLSVAYATRSSPPFGTIILWGGVLGAYVVGLSFIARGEEANIFKRYAPLFPLFIAAFINLYQMKSPTRIFLSFVQAGWTICALFWILQPIRRNVRRAVSWLIAGICFIDVIAVSQMPGEPLVWQLMIFGFFGLALMGQKYIPAT